MNKTILTTSNKDRISGDKLQARDLEQDYLINYIYPKIKWGKLDFVLEDIEAARERLETSQGLSEMKSEGLLDESDTKESVLKRLKNIESVARQMDALHDNLYTRYGNATDKKGNILYDKETKDTELVKWEESIDDYMTREVLPHVPDAKAFFEEDLGKKKPVIKTGAEIPFTRYFYKYKQPTPSEELEVKFMDLELSVSERVSKLFE